MAEVDTVNEETERRIEAARQEAQRQKDVKEFLDSLTDKDSLLKPIYNPEAYVMREKYRGQANRGELKKTACRHPLAYLQQYVDDDPAIKRNSKPVNLFECGVCHLPIWFTDPWGDPLSDD